MKTTAYNDEAYKHGYPPGIEYNYWSLARNEIIKRKLLKYTGPDCCVLDIGCGRGITIDYLAKNGLSCFGSELASPVIPQHLKDSIFISTDAFELDLEFRKKINTILLLDVIEHLDCPENFLKRCQESFPGLKYMIITVPACIELWSNFDEYYGHFTRYSLETLRNLLQLVELASVEMGYFFHAQYLPVRIVTALFKKRAVKWSHPKLLFLHSLLSKGFILEEKIIPSHWIGTSIVAVIDMQAAQCA